jgi:hypothetical protein
MRRTASEAPTTPIEIAKLRSTVDESPCAPEEELDEDEEAVPDVVSELLLVCVVEGIVDEVVEESSRTSNLSYIQSIFFSVSQDDGQLT